MGILYGKFKVDYLNFCGRINSQTGTINYNDNSILGYESVKELTFSNLKKVFDDFYGGKIFPKDDLIILENIPVRVLIFKTEGTSKIVGFGHAQKDSWICDSLNEVVTEDTVSNNHIEKYLKDVMQEFPRSAERFAHILEYNPYEICRAADIEENPHDTEKIFDVIFKKISECSK